MRFSRGFRRARPPSARGEARQARRRRRWKGAIVRRPHAPYGLALPPDAMGLGAAADDPVARLASAGATCAAAASRSGLAFVAEHAVAHDLDLLRRRAGFVLADPGGHGAEGAAGALV